MKKIAVLITLATVAITILNGCDVLEQSTPAYFEITNKKDGLTTSGMYYIDITVKNTGGGAGKNVVCEVTVEDIESDKVYGKTSTIFENGRNIESGDTATARAIFPESGFLALPPEIQFYSYELKWEDVLP